MGHHHDALSSRYSFHLGRPVKQGTRVLRIIPTHASATGRSGVNRSMHAAFHPTLSVLVVAIAMSIPRYDSTMTPSWIDCRQRKNARLKPSSREGTAPQVCLRSPALLNHQMEQHLVAHSLSMPSASMSVHTFVHCMRYFAFNDIRWTVE
jgi:hypothetical protein